jgi:rhs element vgr protein
MGYTFVYNSGNYQPTKKDEMQLSFGLFFDGTNTNAFNTRARKRTYQLEEYEDQSKPENRATALDKALTEAHSKGEEYNKITLQKQIKDNSYNTDFSNVARQFLGVKDSKVYEAIYIEGIGTQPAPSEQEEATTDSKKIQKIVERMEDQILPKAVGRLNTTGIRDKALRACEELAKRIIKIKGKTKNDPQKNKKLTLITIDVFGFSRGATAARNFLYEINGKKREEDIKTTSRRERRPDLETPIDESKFNDYETGHSLVYEDVYYTKDYIKVNPQYLEKGNKLPRFGYLGYLLLESALFTKEDLAHIWLNVRFIGLYDTVSSYIDKDIITPKKQHDKLTGSYKMSYFSFSSGIDSLQLNNIGRFSKAIHLTAADEHRANYSLTRLEPDEKGEVIEKTLPGVHSDVGGSYANTLDDPKQKTMQERVVIDLVDRKDSLIAPKIGENISSQVIKLTEKIIKNKNLILSQYFFRKEDLEVINFFHSLRSILLGSYIAIQGTRQLSKEYSYIPLHFMEQFFKDEIGKDIDNILVEEMTIKYPIEVKEHAILKQVKKRLMEYVFGKGEPLDFPTDENIKTLIDIYTTSSKEYAASLREVAKDKIPNTQRKHSFLVEEIPTPKKETVLITSKKEMTPQQQSEIQKLREDQKLLKELRHKYIHFSSDYASMGMEPAEDRVRKIFDKRNKEINIKAWLYLLSNGIWIHPFQMI